MLKYQISWKFEQWEPSWSMRTDGRTEVGQGERHDEAKCHFLQFRDRA